MATEDTGCGAPWSEALPLPPPPTYVQAQSGDLCRMHAVNAYLGGAALDPATFRLLCDEFDALHGQPPGTTASSGTCYFDNFAVDTASHSILAFLLKVTAGVDVVHLPFDKGHDLDAEARALGASSALAFSAGHVWYMRLTDRGWFRVDSIGSRITAAKPPPGKNHGFVIILDGGVPPLFGADLAEAGAGRAAGGRTESKTEPVE